MCAVPVEKLHFDFEFPGTFKTLQNRRAAIDIASGVEEEAEQIACWIAELKTVRCLKVRPVVVDDGVHVAGQHGFDKSLPKTLKILDCPLRHLVRARTKNLDSNYAQNDKNAVCFVWWAHLRNVSARARSRDTLSPHPYVHVRKTVNLTKDGLDSRSLDCRKTMREDSGDARIGSHVASACGHAEARPWNAA